jgi:hypothetical protein
MSATRHTRPATVPARLYHYTCADSLAGITTTRTLIPNRHCVVGTPLVWLTDLAHPNRNALGLTASYYLDCDRTQIRCDIDPTGTRHITPWWRWARDRRVPQLLRDLLEEDAMPMHWWVSPVPVPVTAVHDLRRIGTRR